MGPRRPAPENGRPIRSPRATPPRADRAESRSHPLRTALRPITILAAAALILTGCAGGPADTDTTGGPGAETSAAAGISSESTAAETLDAYFAAIDAGEATALDALLLDPVGAETIAIPASAPTEVTYQGGDEVNPSAPTNVPMTVDVSYQVG